MKIRAILISSAIFVLVGTFVRRSHLAMMVAEDSGAVFIPVSSGSEDPSILKLGFLSYVISFLFALYSVVLKRGSDVAMAPYVVNCVFFVLCIALISQDSNIIGAAQNGNVIPAFLVLFWIFVVTTVGALATIHGNRNIKDEL